MNEERNVGLRKLKKILILFELLYLFWFKEAFFSVDIVLYILSSFFLVIVVLELISARWCFKCHSVLIGWLLFGVYSFFSGLFIAVNYGTFLYALAKYFIYFLICYEIWNISTVENSIKWILKILIICGFVCSLQSLLFGHHYNNGQVITMAQQNNPNFLATVVLTAIIATLLLENGSFFFNRCKIILVVIFSYVIVLTGSRKIFYALVLLMIQWLFFYSRRLIHEDRKKLLSMVALIIVAGAALVLYNRNIFLTTVMYSKITTQTSAINDRLGLFKEAVAVWKEHPIFGVGFNQFSEYSSDGRFSHSIYAEVLATSGIIGAVIFFVPLFLWLIKIGVAFLDEKNKTIKYYYSFYLLLMIIILALGLGQIWIYEIEHNIISTLVITGFDLTRNNSSLDPNRLLLL